MRCMQALHGGAHAMTARQLVHNSKGLTVVVTQRSGAGGAPEAPHRLSLLSDQPLSPLAELPCGRIEHFEGEHRGSHAASSAVPGSAACFCMWLDAHPFYRFLTDHTLMRTTHMSCLAKFGMLYD